VCYDYRSCCHLEGRKAIVATSQRTLLFTLQQRWSQTSQLTLRHVFEAFPLTYFGVLQDFLQTTLTAVDTSTLLHCFVVQWAWFAVRRKDNDFTSPYCLCVLPYGCWSTSLGFIKFGVDKFDVCVCVCVCVSVCPCIIYENDERYQLDAQIYLLS
jgi:hypothetical protein